MSLDNILDLKRPFQLVAITPPGLINPSIAIAASKAGGIGILNLEFTNDLPQALDAIEQLVYHSKYACGIKLSGEDDSFISSIIPKLPKGISIVVLTHGKPENLAKHVKEIHLHNRLVFSEVTSLEQAKLGHELKVDGLIAKGNESAGFVGEKTAFILFQQIVSSLSLPVWVQGGIGLNTAAACYAGGAAGIVLDSQLYLTKESPFSDGIKKHLKRMDGSETICLGNKPVLCRIYNRPGIKIDYASLNIDQQPENTEDTEYNAVSLLRQYIRKYMDWDEAESSLWPLGQDIAFAVSLAKRFGTVGSILHAIRETISEHVQTVKSLKILNEGSPLATSHGTRYPIVQGPMARISDKAAFLAQVAEGGALPMVALSELRSSEIKEVLSEVKKYLGDHLWGVGLLGFIEGDLLKSQIEAIDPFSPKFAIIAGGLPNQVSVLESKGIATYVHVPSPGILDMFVDSGARRFIFEGYECGGHIGPRSSFVLWETMIEKLLEKFKEGYEPEQFHILFAGGIHDALSASMVAAIAAPLAKHGAKVGVQMGTAYLFTEEIVETGALVKGYQKNVLHCSDTCVLEISPGHALRCCDTPFVRLFEDNKRRLKNENLPSGEISSQLDKLILGRARIASKGVTRNPAYGSKPDLPYKVPVDDSKQHNEGLYMTGQLAAIRDKTFKIMELHYDISVKSPEILALLTPLKSSATNEKPSDIAIIGMACVFPKAGNLQTYWENILNKVNAISEVPARRWDWKLYFDKDKKARDKIYSKWGGFLDEVPFDPLKYGIPPNSLSSIEPLHLLILEVVTAALKDAGYENREFPRENTSVIIGTGGSLGDLGQNYVFRASLPIFFKNPPEGALKHLPEWTEDSFPGILMNVSAGRVTNRFNLGGVNYTVDAACASSLAALYDAVGELETMGSDMVIVGGVDACQSPFTFLCFSKTQALSSQGRCQVFDEKADGIVLGEGLAVLVLKRLSDAERDGDRIYAVIKAVAGSSDGRAKSLTAPHSEGQIRALRRAYRKAGFSPTTVELVEAHGTGTVVGDQVETESVTQLLKENHAANQSCAIGSVKSMIGHTKGAAGMAGLMKVVLSLYYKVLPPTIGIDKPNPKIDFLKGPLYLNTEVRPWIGTDSHPRRAGVNAFGFGGTNFHAVLEEYADDFMENNKQALRDNWPCELLLWSGESRHKIISAIESTKRVLESGAHPSIGDLAFTLHKIFKEQSKNNSSLRLAIVAFSLEDLKEKLNYTLNRLNDEKCEDLSDPRGIYFTNTPLMESGKLAFLFPGQGSQYPNMLRELAVLFPEVRRSFERADSVLKEKFPEKLSKYIFPPPRFSPKDEEEQKKNLSQTNIAQPALGAACYGILKLFKKLNIYPDMTAGHSYGEYIALSAAGVFDEDALYNISESRGRLIIQAASGNDLGTMAAVRASASELRNILKNFDGVVVANINSPRQTVISGDKDALKKAVEFLKSKGIHAQLIPVAGAFHSHVVSPAKRLFSDFLNTIQFTSPQVEVFSNTFAAPYRKTQDEIESCLAEHMVRPVNFVGEIEEMHNRGARIFIEVGPGSVLTNLVKQILEGRLFLALSIDTQGQPAINQLLKTIGQLVVNHVPMSLDRLYQGRSLRVLNLDKLSEGTKEKSSPTAWLVTGSGIRPASGISEAKEVYRIPIEGDKISESRLKESENLKPTSEEIPSKHQSKRPEEPMLSQKSSVIPEFTTLQPVISSDADAIMLQFQQLMSRFLDTQKSIMMAYLQGTSQSVTSDPTTAFNLLQEQKAKIEKLEQHQEQIKPPAYQPQEKTNVLSTNEIKVSPECHELPKEKKFDEGCIREELLRITSERTGYPIEMLNPELNIEADLGIDSIKRVEILGAFAKCFPVSEQQKIQSIMEELSKQKTLSAVMGKAANVLLSESQESTTSSVPYKTALATATEHETESESEDIHVPRFLLEPVETLAPDETLKVPKNGVFIITDDGNGIAASFAKEIELRGGQSVILRIDNLNAETDGNTFYVDLTDPSAVNTIIEDIRHKYCPIIGLIHLLPLERSITFKEMNLQTWRNRLKREVKSLFYIAKALGRDLRDAGQKGGTWLIAATAFDNHYYRDSFIWQAGIAGFLKTLALEWPEVKCRAINLNMANPPSILLDQIFGEMAISSSDVEVKYRGLNRMIYKARPAPLDQYTTERVQIKPDWVILVTGGAIGITAEIATEIAAKYKPTLLLAGRSPFPEEEPFDTVRLTSEQDIKEALIKKMRSSVEPLLPAKVDAAYSRLLKDREIRTNVAKMREAGAKVHYFRVDVRDEQAVGNLIDDIYRSFGRLDGVIHGAGIIEDKLLLDKSPESFDRVFDTKADSAFIMSRKLKPDSLEFIVFFTSVAGSFGNRGQSDYTSANEVVNKLALYMDKQWKGRIVAINWGPWRKIGMVTPELERQFKEKGIQVIPPAAGCRMFEEELMLGEKGMVEVVIGDGPWKT